MEGKVCTKCKEEKPISAFGVDARGKDGIRASCKDCRNAYFTMKRRTDSLTFIGFLYKEIKRRTRGKGTRSPELYIGLDVMSKSEFVKFSLCKSSGFMELFQQWNDNEWSHLMTPSIDRLDSSKGYVEGNIEWVTAQDNYRRATVKREKNRANG